jgi:ribosomal protein S18 acetylase RimI-like enzyme
VGYQQPAGTVAVDAPVRRLTAADLPDCLALAVGRDWTAEERKWGFLLEVGEGYGIDDPAGGLAGSTILTRFADDAAAISMVLVAERHGGRGLGRRLVSHAVERAAGATTFLYATEYGRPLYEKLAFRSVSTVRTQVGRFAPDGTEPAAAVRDATEDDFAAIVQMDAEVFGADRSRLLTSFTGFAERLVVAVRIGRIVGYAGMWRNVNYVALGPVIAEDSAVAQSLISSLAADVAGNVRIDLDVSRPELITWVAERGLAHVYTTSLMIHGEWGFAGDRDRLVVPVMQALG